MSQVLLLKPTPDLGRVVEESVDPFLHRAGDLQQIGLDARFALLDEVATLPPHAYVVLIGDFRWTEAQAIEAAQRARAVTSRRLVFLDSYDQSSSPHFGVMPFVDAYVKKCVLRDRSQYNTDFVGGYIVSDWQVRELGLKLHGWSFGSRIPEGTESKLLSAAFFGWASRYVRLARLCGLASLPWRLRPLHLHARVRPPSKAHPESSYVLHRRAAMDKCDSLRGQFRVTPTTRARKSRFWGELLLSKGAISPFGYGEMCFRDMETFAAGAVLFKPGVEHLDLRPDLFRAGETYVPLKWDFSDLGEKMQHYLIDHPDQGRRIAAAGRRGLLDYAKQKRWLADAAFVVSGHDRMPASS